jgi:hypothetical protein
MNVQYVVISWHSHVSKSNCFWVIITKTIRGIIVEVGVLSDHGRIAQIRKENLLQRMELVSCGLWFDTFQKIGYTLVVLREAFGDLRGLGRKLQVSRNESVDDFWLPYCQSLISIVVS